MPWELQGRFHHNATEEMSKLAKVKLHNLHFFIQLFALIPQNNMMYVLRSHHVRDHVFDRETLSGVIGWNSFCLSVINSTQNGAGLK